MGDVCTSIDTSHVTFCTKICSTNSTVPYRTAVRYAKFKNQLSKVRNLLQTINMITTKGKLILIPSAVVVVIIHCDVCVSPSPVVIRHTACWCGTVEMGYDMCILKHRHPLCAWLLDIQPGTGKCRWGRRQLQPAAAVSFTDAGTASQTTIESAVLLGTASERTLQLCVIDTAHAADFGEKGVLQEPQQ